LVQVSIRHVCLASCLPLNHCFAVF
jgi:hypothetical protein